MLGIFMMTKLEKFWVVFAAVCISSMIAIAIAALLLTLLEVG
jgi:hypothetical protein